MTRHDFGFALTLVLLLIAPEIPFGGTKLSAAGVGLFVWLLLSIDHLPLKLFLRLPSLLCLVGFSIYALLISMGSLRPDAMVYALQFGLYAMMGALLLPAYLADPARRRRATCIFATVAAVYCLALVVTLWTGPIWPRGTNGIHFHKEYNGSLIPRAFGFSDSVNAAGGIAAVMACFAIFVYRGRLRFPLIAVCLAGTVAPMSRSAWIAILAALATMAAIAMARPLLGAPMQHRSGRMRMSTIVLCSALPLILAVSIGPLVAAWGPTAQRMVLDDRYRAEDVDLRVRQWEAGLATWADRDLPQQMLGAGFRSGGFTERRGVYNTTHNAYLEILLDFGVVGAMLFGLAMVATALRFTAGVLRERRPMLAFALVGLAVLAIHNGSEVFFWRPDHALLLVLLLTCGELALLRPRRNIVVPDFKSGLTSSLKGIGSTARDLIPGDPHARGRRKAVHLDGSMWAA